MKKKLVRWLTRYGFIGTMVSKYRLTIRGNGSITIERYYRFRWQELRIRPNGVFWGSGGGRAYFPDAGHAKDGIIYANRAADELKLARKIVNRIVLDADDVILTLDPKEEKSDIPPILERESQK